jgi:hypothetical protein
MAVALLAGLSRLMARPLYPARRVSLKGSNHQGVEKELLLLRAHLPCPARRASLKDLSRPKVGTRQPHLGEARQAVVLGEVVI